MIAFSIPFAKDLIINYQNPLGLIKLYHLYIILSSFLYRYIIFLSSTLNNARELEYGHKETDHDTSDHNA